jgi:hypothetical protein
MMQIYLTNPRHGKKVAIDLKEAELDKKNGWKEVTKDEFFNTKKAEPKSELKPVEVKVDHERDALVEQFKAKHGKAPHHRMSTDSIRAALNDNGEAT